MAIVNMSVETPEVEVNVTIESPGLHAARLINAVAYATDAALRTTMQDHPSNLDASIG